MVGTKKRKRTVDVIEPTLEPSIEHTFYKFPGREAEDVTDYNRAKPYIAKKDIEKRREILRRNPGKSYTDIHTHSSEAPKYPLLHGLANWLLGVRKKGMTEVRAIPSYGDIGYFLWDTKIKTAVIAVRNPKTGEVQGYQVMRKTKNTPNIENWYGEVNKDFDNDLTEYCMKTVQAMRKNKPEIASSAFDNLARKYHIKHRMLPAKDYTINETKSKFVKKKGLEKTLETLILICLGASILLLSSNFTGNVISNLNQKSSNWIGGILFIIGLIGAFVYFKRK